MWSLGEWFRFFQDWPDFLVFFFFYFNIFLYLPTFNLRLFLFPLQIQRSVFPDVSCAIIFQQFRNESWNCIEVVFLCFCKPVFLIIIFFISSKDMKLTHINYADSHCFSNERTHLIFHIIHILYSIFHLSYFHIYIVIIIIS